MLTNAHALHRFNLSIFLHFIGRGLYATFVPIIMLKAGYSLRLVLVFLLASALITIASSWLSLRAYRGKQLLFFYLFGIVCEIALLLLLASTNKSLPIFSGIIAFEALYYTFYYLAYYAILSQYNIKQKTSATIGNTQIAIHLSGLLSPLIGALLLGQSALALGAVAALFLGVSVIPIAGLAHLDGTGKEKSAPRIGVIQREVVEYIMLSAIEVVVFTFWAITVHLSGFSLLAVASIPVADALVRIAITQKMKIKIKNLKFRERSKVLSLIAIALLSLYRYLWPAHVLATNLLFGLFFMMLHLTIETDLFKKLKDYQPYQSAAYVSIIAFAARSIAVIAALVIGLRVSILLPIPIALGYFFFQKNRTQ